jgi:hypothetical protein
MIHGYLSPTVPSVRDPIEPPEQRLAERTAFGDGPSPPVTAGPLAEII